MKVVTVVARIVFGLGFTVAGIFGFIFATATPPPMPGLAGDFMRVFFESHLNLFVAAIQLATGVLLLVNRYVPLALVASAAVLYNILAFHLTMMPSGIVPGLVLTACWVIVALAHRDALTPLLEARSDAARR